MARVEPETIVKRKEMNSMTTFPHSQVLLSPSVASLYWSDGAFEAPKKITWCELYALINTQLWRRMVMRVQDGHLDTLVLAGLFRIVKNTSSQKVTMQRKSLQLDCDLMPTWSWVTTSYLPDFMMQSFQGSLVWRFRRILEFSVGEILKDLDKQGFTTLEIPVKAAKSRLYDGVDASSAKTVLLDIGDVANQWAIDQFSKQFGFLEQGIKQGSRSLYKHLWHFIDKEKLSIYLQIYQCSLSQVSFKTIHKFSRIVVDVQRFKEQALWLPWLSVLPIKVRERLNQPNLFSYEFLLSNLPDEVSKGAVRKINRQPRRIQVLLIEANMWTPQELALVDALDGYPTLIKAKLLSEIKERKEFGELRLSVGDCQRVQRAVFRWAQYFSSMIGQVKARKQREQWQRALNQFSDVLSWVIRSNGVVHKNQKWYALVQQHEKWVEQLNRDDQTRDTELDALSWESAEWDRAAVKNGKVEIEEITQGAKLRLEGSEMEHCVWSYLSDCLKQRYRVFSLRTPEERVTLGLYMDPVTLKCTYDQLRGPNNDIASRPMQQLAKRLIKQINAR
ncbi:PcfJ domain-containing protein (plasmid) [Vibrio scophthalmi]|uniref:PcfJ domain-containing protein n=2 Tax=Vibrio scophthalmi TaxID=45658 RepID=UPI0009F6E847